MLRAVALEIPLGEHRSLAVVLTGEPGQLVCVRNIASSPIRKRRSEAQRGRLDVAVNPENAGLMAG